MATVATKSAEHKTQQHTGSCPSGPVATESVGPYATILRMQQTIGNRAVRQIVQAKLTVSTPGDRYEQEADSVADQVMRMSNPEPGKIPGFSMAGRDGVFNLLQRKCADCETEVHRKQLCDECEEKLQRKALCHECDEKVHRTSDTGSAPVNQGTSHGQVLTDKVGANINAARGAGHPLAMPARAFFEPRFGYDFGAVRIHHGDTAASLARSLNARAFTIGRDIFFGANQYSSETPSGRHLMAHELTHVVQQSSDLRSSWIPRPAADSKTHSMSMLARKPSSFVAEGQLVQREISVGDVVLGVFDPKTIIGKVWLGFSPETKAKYVNQAIDGALLVVDKFPGAAVLGGVWEFLKAGLIGFYGKLKTAKDDVKIKAIDTIATIMAGQSLEYSLALLKGLAKGFFIEGAAGIFIAAWDLLKGLNGLWDFLKGIADSVGGFPEEMQNLLKNMRSTADELLANIGPAIEEFITEGSDPDKIKTFLNVIAEKGKAVAKEAGEKIADALLGFLTKKGAEADIGEAVGLVVGQVLWEVVFAAVTAGAGAAVTAGKTAVKEAARVLAKVVAKVVGSILKIVEEIRLVFGKVIEVVKKAITFVKGKLSAVASKLAELFEGVWKFLKRLLDNCHESKLVCTLAKTAKQFHENVLKPADVLRREARQAFLQAYPKLKGKIIEVHHRIPLEWRKLFPQADPNRLSNLQGLTKQEHLRKASDMWDAFRAAYKRKGIEPTAVDVLRHAMLVDRSLNLPYPL